MSLLRPLLFLSDHRTEQGEEEKRKKLKRNSPPSANLWPKLRFIISTHTKSFTPFLARHNAAIRIEFYGPPTTSFDVFVGWEVIVSKRVPHIIFNMQSDKIKEVPSKLRPPRWQRTGQGAKEARSKMGEDEGETLRSFLGGTRDKSKMA